MDFKGKKVAVIGVGIEGVSTAKYLIDKGAEPVLFDKKNIGEFERSVGEEIKKLRVLTFLGREYLDSLQNFDLVFRSPGVRPDLPALQRAEKKGAKITSQTKLFFDLCPAPIIGITGTKGKGTTSALIYDILKTAGKKVFLGGNIGNPPLAFLGKVTQDSIVVLELSSFQLIDINKSPHICVVLMVTSEHLDWHRGEDEYIKAKTQITKYQTAKDFAVINDDYPTSREIGEISKARKYYFSTKKPVENGAYIDQGFVVLVTNGWTSIVKTSDIKLIGEHNLQNIAAATVVAGLLEIPPDTVAKAIKAFTGLPHRLEFVGEVSSVKFYDDSASTIPETTVAAVQAFENPKILILGGASKHSDFTLLGKAIVQNNIKAAILTGEEAVRIRDSIDSAGGFSGKIIEGPSDMKQIVQKAKTLSELGDIVLLSPACASFDMYKNYMDRGEQFKAAVRSLG
ncbi:MAG: UDP-N-acetylmuramoylalanine--D-glutamate ligase [Candidatus Woykebacteria bacterium RBG_19FT_COMBO_43_10]|uniref:UDP-N-acetylmuramoylalanine--D-glutamate ligase n=1 Tax=Candidatus Woykebacteria bacterium RBG_19FT_COMBO_43_10 TaxID=1802598 RepID=A0A1G1WL75_9BACT|nr:MAG: UDP-N-acetylmuramoylalanine--D-glutamate ligase [Candidatus Woykebacteria bacterium RBG_19FT_COMBO_43_10]